MLRGALKFAKLDLGCVVASTSTQQQTEGAHWAMPTKASTVWVSRTYITEKGGRDGASHVGQEDGSK